MEPLLLQANLVMDDLTYTQGEVAFCVDQVTVVEQRVAPAGMVHGEGLAEMVPVGAGAGTVTVATWLAGTQVLVPNRLKHSRKV